jgi:2-C-methyl-D-erythritol 4-phosphate cytidylyltransferase
LEASLNVAIIVAAGQGTRMGHNIDKIFLEVAGKPVVAHTWAAFEACGDIGEIVLVVRSGMESAFNDLAKVCRFRKPYKCVPGGKERQDSVWNGLQGLSSTAEFVAIQDAARPCTTPELISLTLAAASRTGAAVAAQKVPDTIKESEDGQIISRHLDRSRLWSVQTPQTFRVSIILKALQSVREKGLIVTDDTAACELIGQKVEFVESCQPNPKITVPGDLSYLEILLRKNSQ